MAGSLGGENGAAVDGAVGIEGDAGSLGEAGGPIADRDEAEAAIGFAGADHGPEGIEVGNEGAIGAVGAAAEGGADGSAAGNFVGDMEGFEFFADLADDRVGVAGGAVDSEQSEQELAQVSGIDGGGLERRGGLLWAGIHV